MAYGTIAVLSCTFIYAMVFGGYWYDGTKGLVADAIKTFDCVVPSVLIMVFLIVMRDRRLFRMPIPMLLALSAVLILHNIGIYLSLYDQFILWWDKVTHFLASLVVAGIGLLLLIGTVTEFRMLSLSDRFLTLFVMGFTSTFGLLWEVYELWSDELLGSTMQYMSYLDTMQDLLSDLLGAVVVSIVGILYLRRSGPGRLARAVHIDTLLSRLRATAKAYRG